MAQGSLSDWAVPQLSRLLGLDDESLKQIVVYSDTLSREDAAEHLKNLLGDSPQALEFISSFQSRRSPPPVEPIAASTTSSRDVSESEVPRAARGRQKKKKPPLNALPPPRLVEQPSDISRAYLKQNASDYMSFTQNKDKAETLSNTLALQSEPDALQLPVSRESPSPSPARGSTSSLKSTSKQPKLPPSASGTLISDSPRPASPSSSSAGKQPAKAKVNLSGGTSMRGASTALSDLESAIRALELQTNPSLSASSEEETKRRKCNCMAQRHPLLAAAPNCLSCGKIVCIKEGLGPCTFCGQPILRSEDLQAMIRILREERGKEKMEVNNAAHKRAEVAKTPRPFSSSSTAAPASNPGSSAATPALSRAGTPTPDPDEEKLAAAKAHRDRLLQFQAQNTQRTSIRDEAADFATPADGQSGWATPLERALQLKRQQRALREQEWNAKPEWEKKRVVVSIDVKGGRAVRKMAEVERPGSSDGVDDSGDELALDGEASGALGLEPATASGTGRFSRNPLLGGLIKPVFQPKGKEKSVDKADRKATWRRVQDENDDNEQWILDGGAYGDMIDGRVLSSEEPACG